MRLNHRNIAQVKEADRLAQNGNRIKLIKTFMINKSDGDVAIPSNHSKISSVESMSLTTVASNGLSERGNPQVALIDLRQ
jgi:hypothetical protein